MGRQAASAHGFSSVRTRNSVAILGSCPILRSELVALAAQHAHQIGGQRNAEQRDDVLTR